MKLAQPFGEKKVLVKHIMLGCFGEITRARAFPNRMTSQKEPPPLSSAMVYVS